MPMSDHARILMYSHDTFGLGHLTRCRVIATSLIRRYKDLGVLIITGSPIAGTFSFPARVDFVKVPSVIKLYNGEYTSMYERIDLEETLEMRKSIIHNTITAFKPDVMIVDKTPLGLKYELEDILADAKQRGVKLALGLRDVMDAPERLREEWDGNDVLAKTARLYDKVWVYGTRGFWHPLSKLDVPSDLDSKIGFTGFLKREPSATQRPPQHDLTNPYILVTVGGGGDGEELIDWVLTAYERDTDLPHPALLVLGPFMQAAKREAIRTRAARLGNVRTIDYGTDMGRLMAGAIGVVAMGGYNTFCEILSYDKRAIIVPRAYPRQEQLIRARRAQEMGLVKMIHPDRTGDREIMTAALRELSSLPLPSSIDHNGLLAGLDIIGGDVGAMLKGKPAGEFQVIEGGA